MIARRIDACRACGGAQLDAIVDLGATPLANRLLAREELAEPEPRVPLVLVFCPACSLVQITETVAPEILFREYFYFSSFSNELLEHSRAHAEELRARRRLGPSSLVVEVASNDGYLLRWFVEAGVPVLGVEPARNIAEVANQRGVRTVAEFFGLEQARALKLEGYAADVLLGNNVLAHVADLGGFVAGAAELITDDGIVEFEFPYVGDLIDRVEFDTIYHEHLCYFSAHAIERLFARHGLVLTDVRRLPIHGGSLRVTGARRAEPEGRARAEALLDEERRRGLDRFAYYASLAGRVDGLKRELTALLEQLRNDGRRVAAYGASAKGSTLLNCFGIGAPLVEYVVDRSTVKQGRFTPGTHLPIFAPERLVEDRPDYALLLTWNFADEILRQQAEYRRLGGRFIVPVPEVRVVEPL
ncbi:MAG TPA: class I SAM-dependent methyltransferase [Polyangia bacterium]|nr:class I SAM-dependent methyltransferase [Polyangia bacterium]